MPIPDLTSDGVLPPGVHDCSIEEIKSPFGWFGSSGKRHRLYQRLVEFVGRVLASDLVVSVIVDGSFVTSASDPGDVDLLLGVRERNESGLLRPVDYNVISKRRVRKQFEFDILVAIDGTDEFREYVEFFSQVKGRPGAVKGLLRVIL
jgi:hypothetical protein